MVKPVRTGLFDCFGDTRDVSHARCQFDIDGHIRVRDTGFYCRIGKLWDLSDEKAIIAMVHVWTRDVELDCLDINGFGNFVRYFRIFFI